MTPEEQNWLTWGAIRHRPHGASRWQEAGTRAAIAKHCGTWGLAEATAHVLAHARDPKANTPNVIASRFSPDNEPGIGGHPHPPRREQECRTHPGQYRDRCGGCAADRAPDPDYGQPSQLTQEPAPTPARVPPAGDRDELITNIREQIKAAKAALQPPVTKAGRQEEAHG